MSLQGETGGSAADRRAEMARLLVIVEPHIDEMSLWEIHFIGDMMDNMTSEEWTPTPRQLFKLRDIKDKY